MEGYKRHAGVICSTLILILAIIHLAVSSSIIGRFRHYKDVFRPEVSLSAFNIVISVLALLIGASGLFAALTHRGKLGKLVGFISIILAIFVLASLITALIINSLAINYVNSRFTAHMDAYKINRNSRDIIDRIQTKYDCCGNNIWLDWKRVSLNATTITTTSTTSPANVTETTTTAVANVTESTTSAVANVTTSTTTVVVSVTEITTTEIDSTEILTSEDTTIDDSTDVTELTDRSIFEPTSDTPDETNNGKAIYNTENFENRIKRSFIDHNAEFEYHQNIIEFADNFDLQQIVRQKRQAQSNYGGIPGLPLDFVVVLPQSCCTNDLSSINSLSNSYCLSNASNGQNRFHIDGCTKSLGRVAIGQTLGLTVINSILFVLSLAAIYIFIRNQPSTNPVQTVPERQSTYQYVPQNGGYHADIYNQYGQHNYPQFMDATGPRHDAPTIYRPISMYGMY